MVEALNDVYSMAFIRMMKDKHKKDIDRKHALHSMLMKGNTESTNYYWGKNSEIQKRGHNRRVISKFIKTIYYMCRKKWAVKNNLEYIWNIIMEHIKNLGDEDLIKHKRYLPLNIYS